MEQWKRSRTLEMWPIGCYPAACGYPMADYPTEGEGDLYRHLTSPTPTIPLQEDYTEPAKQPVVVGNENIGSVNWSTYSYHSISRAVHAKEARVVGKSTPAIAVPQYPTQDTYLLPQTHTLYTSAAASIPGHANNNIAGCSLSPYVGIPTDNNRAKSRPRSSSAMRTTNYEVHSARELGSLDFEGARPVHTVTTGSALSDRTSQIDPMALREAGRPSRDAAHSISGLPGGVRNGVTTGPPVRSPLLPGANNFKPGNKAERKGTTTEHEPRKVKPTKQGRPQRLDLHGPVQSTQFLSGRPDLHTLRQVVYRCQSSQIGWARLPDINFGVGGKEGIKLTDAMDAYFDGPDGRDDLMFTDGSVGSSVTCRIIFEGYQACGKTGQISTTNHKRERVRITRRKLAQVVAKCVGVYLEELKSSGTPFHIPFEDMLLTKLIHVARASWQPEICC